MPSSRESFASRLGFVLAAAGSAVGLGNIWKFPYVAGSSGGGAFLILYLVIVFTLGLSVMLAEIALGRATRANPVGAYNALGGRRWSIAGWLGVITGPMILSFYSVVGGWTIHYAVQSVLGRLDDVDGQALGQAFEGFISDPVAPLAYHAAFMALTIGVVIGGVAKGIERWSKLLMPALFVMLIVLAGRALTLDGAAEGVAFFLTPDFSKVTGDTVLAALGQAFFSLSLGMGALITYGSYLARRENAGRAALTVTALDTTVALLAGLIVLPAVFAFGVDPAAGPGLVFVTLPGILDRMPAGQAFAVLFFVLLGVAALTSAISLLEVPVAYLTDEHGWHRRRATLATGLFCFVIGVPASLSLGAWSGLTVFGLGAFDLMDYLTSKVMLPAGGILVALFVGWKAWPILSHEIGREDGPAPTWGRAWRLMLCVVAPVAIAWVMWGGL